MTKKLLVVALGLLVALAVASVAQENAGQSEASGKAAAAPLKTLKGTVKADGDKVSFVDDADQKSWDVVNPETLKDHVGHHVQVSAHVYADKGQIHVMKVKMLKEKEKSSSM